MNHNQFNLKLFAVLGLIILGVLLTSGCTGETNNQADDATISQNGEHATAESGDAKHTEATLEHHWTYEGESGPDNWNELGFSDCSGDEQSPIDIPSGTSIHDSGIVFSYNPSALNIVNNGHTIKVAYDKGSMLEVGNKTYELLQLHFHSLSEHTIEGESSEMEVHFVHQSNDGEYAVVGAMLVQGNENTAYTPIWNNLPLNESELETIDGVNINASDLLPENLAYYQYKGSFTTPPCTEGVNWFILDTPIELSSEQIAAFEDIYSSNYRPIQALGQREFT